MNRRNRVCTACLLAILIVGAVQAQESPGFDLREHTINSGGHPDQGSVLQSSSFRISLDAIGDAVQPMRVSSSSYSVSGGFVGTYPPPGEVSGLRFKNRTLLAWDGEPSTGAYNLYRDLLGALTGGDFGQCFKRDLPDTDEPDAEVPGPGEGFFYLVTAKNRLEEEGTKGESSSGAYRGGTSCP